MGRYLAMSIGSVLLAVTIATLLLLQRISDLDSKLGKEHLKLTLLELYSSKASEDTVKYILGDPRQVESTQSGKKSYYSRQVGPGDVWRIDINFSKGKVIGVATENFQMGDQ